MGGMVKRSSRQRLRPGDVAEVRHGLQRILGAIGRREVTAGSGYVAGLEGAIAALDALPWYTLAGGAEARPDGLAPAPPTLRPEGLRLAATRLSRS